MSAALLRKLMLDKGRLMDQVNRSHRLDLRFRISGVSPLEQLFYDDSPMFWTTEDGLDPDSPLAYAPLNATRDQFLARRVLRFGGSWITVRDVIDQLANIEEPSTVARQRTNGREHSRRRQSSITVPDCLEQ